MGSVFHPKPRQMAQQMGMAQCTEDRCLCAQYAMSQTSQSVAGVPATDHSEGMQAPWHAIIQLANLFRGYLCKCNRQGVPQVITTVEHAAGEQSAHHWPDMFNGVHVRAVRRPNPLVKQPNSLVVNEVHGGSSTVNRCSILHELVLAGSVKTVEPLKGVQVPDYQDTLV